MLSFVWPSLPNMLCCSNSPHLKLNSSELSPFFPFGLSGLILKENVYENVFKLFRGQHIDLCALPFYWAFIRSYAFRLRFLSSRARFFKSERLNVCRIYIGIIAELLHITELIRNFKPTLIRLHG